MKPAATSPSSLQVIFRQLLVFSLLAALFLPFRSLRAASTGATEPFTIQGAGAVSSEGDDINVNGLSYSYFVEVPPGLASLVIGLFDADISGDGPAQQRDQTRTGGADTTCNYTRISPSGVSTLLLSAGNGGTCPATGVVLNNNWCPFTQASPEAGHWELRVRCPTGDDSNALGVRAHDGTAGSGGTELNVYYDSFTNYGRNNVAAGTFVRTYFHYPWVTRNCSVSANDFDADDDGVTNNTEGADTTLTSRIGTFMQTRRTAGDNMWRSESLSGWNSSGSAVDYGLWTLRMRVGDRFPRPPNDTRNYLTFSLTDDDTPRPGPLTGNNVSQPDVNAFRVYLSTDAIDDGGGVTTKPAKPYLRQIISYLSGPANPPGVGQTASYAVSIGISNPTSRPIVFSSSNFIRSVVPTPANGTVTYQGITSSSPGGITILAQPSIGGTGQIDWHPGTLAAGTNAAITYTVNVTPTMAPPQTIPVTGTPGTLFSGSEAGTTARYVDETGNTTQARATYTFGPICQLSVPTNMLTYALVADFAAYVEAGRVVVEWETATEAGTLGFDLERVDARDESSVRVNSQSIPALAGAPQGARYRWRDDGAPTNGRLRYVLVEHDIDGQQNRYGPFEVEIKPVPPGPRPVLDAQGYAAQARIAPPELLPAGRHEAVPEAAPPGSPSGPNQEFKIAVGAPGLYKLDYGALLEEIVGTSRQGSPGRRGLSLYRGGQEIAWLPGETAYSLYFYAEAIDSPYTDDNVYWLRLAVGSRMGSESAAPSGPANPAASFPATEHYEDDAFVATAIAADPDSDYWFWKPLAPGTVNANQSFTLTVADPATTSRTAQLDVGLRAATTSGVAGEHHVEVWLNGSKVGDAIWEGKIAHVAQITFSQTLLQPGANLVELRAQSVAGVSGDAMYADAFDLAYERLYRASGDRLVLSGAGNDTVAISGFSQPDVRLYRITDPARPAVVTGGVIEGGPGNYSLRFSPSSPEDVYLALTPSAILSPVWTAPKAELPNFGQGADYLVIAPQALISAAERLADYRTSQGHTGRAVALEAIYDTYRGGIPDPNAIRDFLAEAASWPLAARYAVLVGEGSLDYRNLLGHGGNLIPPKMVQTPNGLFSSDLSLGDVAGDDGVPEVIVGRLSVVNTAELDSWINKLIAYESGLATSEDSLLLLADNPDAGGDFTGINTHLESLISARPVERIDLEGATTANTRAALFAALSSGANVLAYSGHGGIDRIATEGLLTVADVAALADLETLPVVTALTCTIGRFEVPGFPSLAEELVRRPGGAMAVWAPSGLASAERSRLLGDRFLRAIYQSEERTLGEALATALRQLSLLEPLPPAVFNLFGDPALRLQIAPATPIPGPTSGGKG